MKSLSTLLTVPVLLVTALVAGCAGAAPTPTPTKPAAVPATAAPATTVPAPTAVAAPTKAPAAPPTAAPAKKVDFPAKGRAVTILVGLPAGGSCDIAYRLLAPLLEKELRTPVEIVNKPGAATQTSLTELVRSKPDGYTLASVSMAASVLTYLDPERKAIYSRKDFQPVAHYATEPNLITVKADSPFKDVKDLVDAAKANPAGVKVGTTSLMGNAHLGMVALEDAAKAKFALVHFDGTSPAMTALLGGHIDALATSTGGLPPQVKEGKLRVLGLMDKEESRFFPGVKTFEGQGFKVFMTFSYGPAAPAGTPMEVVDVLTTAIKSATANEELKKKLDDLALVPRYMDPVQFDAFWAEVETQIRPLLDLVKKSS